MIKSLLFFASMLLLPFLSTAQIRTQYFDGADTLVYRSIFITLEDSADNTWQIGPPKKAIFDSAATFPNVLVTDTLNNYPPEDTSVFTFRQYRDGMRGIAAVRWKQKLDMVKGHACGFVEYSSDTGKTWKNVFKDPDVYKFYGFDTLNVDTLSNGAYAFTGTDTTWKDIWLCFEYSSSFSFPDTMLFRFTFVSDTSSTTGEGWMIDNIMVHNTIFHTVKSATHGKAIRVYPTVTQGKVTIDIDRQVDEQVFKNISLLSSDGKLLKQYQPLGSTYSIDIGNYASGIYYLKITTDKTSFSYPVQLSK